jgi:hypothetical protein
MRVLASKDSIASTYVSGHTYIGLATGDPSTSTTVSNEATGGSPAYARKATTWSTGGSNTGIQNGTQVSIDCPAGTFTYMLVAAAATGVQWDNCTISSTTLSASGPLIVTPTVTVT